MVYELEYCDEIEYVFFLKGHSKHSNDQGFGVIQNGIEKIALIETYNDLTTCIQHASS